MTERRFYPPSESDIPLHGWRPYSDMHRERIRAHAKHDERGGSMERKHFRDPTWLPVLVEEVGEVARVLCDAKLGVLTGNVGATLREELVQLGAMTAAWVDAIDAEPFTGVIPPLVAKDPQPVDGGGEVHVPFEGVADPNCPNLPFHGNPFRYCPTCPWVEAPEADR